MATMMKMAGAVGFITNGSIRDIEGVRQVGLACWGAGLSPMHGRLRWLDVNSPVVIDGMTVRPGDLIHADVNGAIVIPAQVADRVYEQALKVRQSEQAYFATLRQPGLTLDAYLSQGNG
jgi:regulator of RNase E activity RraA